MRFPTLILLLSFFGINSISSQCSIDNSNSTTSWRGLDLSLSGQLFTEIDPISGNFMLGNNLLTIRDASISSNPIINLIANNGNNANSNDWFAPTNLPLNQQGALDILFTAQSGHCLFQDLGFPDFLVAGDNAFINTVSHPNFGGAYALYSGDFLGPNFPSANIAEIDPKEIAHEFMHMYISRNFPLLLEDGTVDGDIGGLIEGLCDIAALLIDSEMDGSVTGITNWVIEGRNLMSFPTPYNSPQYNINLGVHRKGLILGHWFYLVHESACFNSNYDAFIFLMECFQEFDVCNYPTLREATLEHIQSKMTSNGNSCNDCYNNLITAWNTLGVGSAQQYESANIINNVVTNCSVFAEWEDKGYQYHECKLFELGNITPISTECVSYQNFYFTTLTQNTDNFILEIQPMCDISCTDPLNVPSTPLSIIKPGIGNNPKIMHNGFATGCDIVIELSPSLGLDPNLIEFTINSIPSTPISIDCVEGAWFFHFTSNSEYSFPLDYVVDLHYCNYLPIEDTIQSDPTFINNFQLGIIQSKCAVQAVIPNGIEFPLNTEFTPRIASITQNEFNNFNNGILSLDYDANNFRFNNSPEIIFPGPNIPPIEIPFDAQGANNQFFIMSTGVYNYQSNPNHPLAPDILCYNRHYPDCVVFSASLPTNCTQNISVTTNFCSVGNNTIVDFILNGGNLSDISHIEYQYRLQNDNMWSECHSTIGNTVIIENIGTTSSIACPGALEVEATVVCDCNIGFCQTQTFNNTGTIDNQCPPVEFIGIEHCGEILVVDFHEAPGAYGYEFKVFEINQNEVFNTPVYTCLIQDDCNNFLNTTTSITTGIEVANISAAGCPHTNRTADFHGLDPNASYRVEINAVCCTNNAEPDCDPSTGQFLQPHIKSNCTMHAAIGPSCGFGNGAMVTLSHNNSLTNINASWTDLNIQQDQEYIVKAIPLDCELSENLYYPGTNLSMTLDNLLPNIDYRIEIHKDCSGQLCVEYTDVISAEISNRPQLEFEDIQPVCPSENGFITINLPTGFPEKYTYDITPNALDFTFSNNQLIFEIETPGIHTISINTCETTNLSWDFDVTEVSCNQINVFQSSDCELSADLSGCSEYNSFTWQYASSISEPPIGLNIDTEQYEVSLAGFYRICATIPQCEDECSDYIFVDGCQMICENADLNISYIIDANSNQNFSSFMIQNGGNVPANQISPEMFAIDGIDFVVSGNLILDNSFLFTNCNFFFEENASILADSPNVNFNDCNLTSCTTGLYWQGIYSTANNYLGITNSSEVSNAITAVTMNTAARIVIKNSTFSDNTTCLFAPPGSEYLIQSDFTDNTFKNGVSGIEINDMNFEYASSVGSTITNIDKPIVCKDASTEFRNLTIVGSFVPEDIGIDISNNSHTELENISISLCDTGIDLKPSIYSENILNDVTISSPNNGLIFEGTYNYLYADNLDIKNSTTAIDLMNSEFNEAIFSNTITTNVTFGFDITNSNKIEIIDSNLSGVSSQIRLNDCQNIEIQGGVIGSTGLNNFAIDGKLLNAISIRDVTFNSMNSDLFLEWATDFYICGNEFNGNTEGCRLRNCSYSTELNYADNDHFSVLGIDIEDSSIGPKPHAGNKFYQSSGEINTAPSSSEFPINTTNNNNLGGILRPTTSNVPIDIWFVENNSGSSQDINCMGSDPFNPEPDPQNGIGGGDIILPNCDSLVSFISGISSDSLPGGLSESQKFNIIFQLLLKDSLINTLNDTTALLRNCYLEVDSILQVIHTQYENTELLQIADLTNEMESAFEPTPSQVDILNSYNYRISDLKNRIRLLNPENDIQLERIIRYKNIIEIYRHRKNIYINRYTNQRRNRFLSLKNQLLSFTSDNEIEKLYIKKLLLECEIALGNYNVISENINEIIFISNLCPTQYGEPVYFARILREKYDRENVIYGDDHCNQTQQRSLDKNDSYKFVIAPNPTTGVIALKNIENLNINEIEVFDFKGKGVFKTKDINNQDQFPIDLSYLNDGIYYLIAHGENFREVHKLIILND